MQTLRVELKPLNATQVKLRYWMHSGLPETRQVNLTEIQPLIDQGKLYYYRSRPNLKRIGQQLFSWVDGDGRWLSRMIQTCSPPGLILAIATDAKLAHLPWEALHNGQEFLVERLGTPIIPIRWVSGLSPVTQAPKSRPLRVLFMATEPMEIENSLDFEQEEAKILEFTADLPLTLRVEESGCIKSMGTLWRRHPGDTFDIFHLTGHASIKQEIPVFMTETETGELKEARAEEILSAFERRIPQLVFLSGCRTAQSGNDGAISSMSETLVRKGIPAVLGWGYPVLDSSATIAAAQLYQRLAEGFSIVEALGATYAFLHKQKVLDWHLLRLHARDEAWQALVEPPGDYFPPLESVRDHFLDSTEEIRVAGPEQFVGRRRLLQRSLKHIRSHLGILLHGFGGNGKSTLAARLLERLPAYTPIVIYRQLDKTEIVARLAQQCESESGLQILNGELPLMQKLSRFLREGLNQTKQRFCFVLDDFEFNLEPDLTGKQVLQASVVTVLNDLLQAIIHSKQPHRIIITSRYNTVFPEKNNRIVREFVPALSGIDLAKKYKRLPSFQSNSSTDPALQEHAKQVADGNPLLLERLDLLLQAPATDQLSILESIKAKEKIFREEISLADLLKQQANELLQLLNRTLIFQLPVPKDALSVVLKDILNWEQHLERSISLGLIEVSITSGQLNYRVPRIVEPLSSLPLFTKSSLLYETAAETLRSIWLTSTHPATETQCKEIYRLAISGKSEQIIANVCTTLSGYWNEKSRFRDSINISLESLQYCENPVLKLAILQNLAQAYRSSGDIEQAVIIHNQELDIAKEQENISMQIAALDGLGSCYFDMGNFQNSLQCYQKATSLLTEIKDVASIEYMKPRLHHNAGVAFGASGNIQKAITQYDEVLKSGQASNRQLDPAIESSCYINLCDCHGLKGEIEVALHYAQKALEVLDSTQDIEAKGTTIHSIAELLIDKGYFSEAIQTAEEGLELICEFDSHKIPSELHSVLSLAYLNLKEYEDALRSINRAEEFNYPQNNHYVLLLKGIIFFCRKDENACKAWLLSAFKKAQELIDIDSQNYEALDTQWISLHMIALIEENALLQEQKSAHLKSIARKINSERGVVKRLQNLLSLIKT